MSRYRFVIEEFSDVMRRFSQTIHDDGDTKALFPFLHSMLFAAKLGQPEALAMALTMFSDGMTSLGPAMVYMLHLLAANPDKQARLFDEVSRLLETDDRVTPEKIEQARYLKACVKEMTRYQDHALSRNYS